MVRFLKILESPTFKLPRKFDIAFTTDTVDLRGTTSKRIIETNSKYTMTVQFKLADFLLMMNGTDVRIDEISDTKAIRDKRNYLFDATNLDFAELLTIIRAIKNKGKKSRIGFVYVEPTNYKLNPERGAADLHSFSLSKGYGRLSSLPGFAKIFDQDNKAYMFAFLGYESNRLYRAMNEDEGSNVGRYSIVFGVPPFKPMWEMHSLMQNVSILKDYPPIDIHFVGASNPVSAYRVIEQQCASLEENETLLLAPFGTKPTTVAAALFAANNPEIAVIYDFPMKMANRSDGIGPIHYFEVEID